MQDMQDMIDRLNQSGKRLSKGHRKIAQYIVEHYDKAVFMTASRLGESVGVSESTVVRFAAAMRFAKRCGAQVVAITDGPMSPLAEIADLSLTARTDMASFVDSLAAPLSLINALLVTLGLHRKQALSQHFKQLESIWETYEVYLEEEGHGDVRS